VQRGVEHSAPGRRGVEHSAPGRRRAVVRGTHRGGTWTAGQRTVGVHGMQVQEVQVQVQALATTGAHSQDARHPSVSTGLTRTPRRRRGGRRQVGHRALGWWRRYEAWESGSSGDDASLYQHPPPSLGILAMHSTPLWRVPPGHGWHVRGYLDLPMMTVFHGLGLPWRAPTQTAPCTVGPFVTCSLRSTQSPLSDGAPMTVCVCALCKSKAVNERALCLPHYLRCTGGHTWEWTHGKDNLKKSKR
jgi:hypothetical protein